MNSFALLFLFNSYCTSFYGANLWRESWGCLSELRRFASAYHSAIKRIFRVSTRESSHRICNFADLLTFEHQIRFNKVRFIFKIIKNPCSIISKNLFVVKYFKFYADVLYMLRDKYNMFTFLENDLIGIKARFFYVLSYEIPSF